MATGFNRSVAHWVLDSLFGDDRLCPVIPATIYFGPLSGVPTYDAGTGVFTAVEQTDQDRIEVDNDSVNFPNASGREKRLAVRIDGDLIVTEWADATEFYGVYAASTGGTPFLVVRLDSAVNGPEGGHLFFEIDSLRIPLPVGA